MAGTTKRTTAKKKAAASKRSSKKTPPHTAALITGASGGIGEALAHEFARDGSNLILVARSEDKLTKIAEELEKKHDIVALTIPLDLSVTGAASDLFGKVADLGVHVETLVNNAGIMELGAFADTSTARHLELVQLNIVAVTEMTSLFVPAMVERGKGHILNVASIAAFQPIPSLATYAATKSYVLSLTESLSEELKQNGISVTALCPGITDTNMVADVKSKNDAAAKIPGFMVSDVEAVAAEGYAAMKKGEVIRVPGIVNMAAAVAGRASPRWLVRAVSGAFGRMAL
jgi:uncharacterized protein